MFWIIRRIASAFFLLPLNILLILGLGLLLLRRSPRLGTRVLVFGWALLWILSTPAVSFFLQQSIQSVPPLSPTATSDDAQAIVVLGSGSYCHAPEYQGNDSVTASGLERLRYAARLHRQTHKPILVTGGKLSNPTAEALFMKEALEQDFQVPVRWTEEEAHNTRDNARFSYAILHPQGVTRIYLITHASHMARAQMVFEQAGFHVIPAPTRFATRCGWTPLDLIPSLGALAASAEAIYETLGLAWYRLGRG